MQTQIIKELLQIPARQRVELAEVMLESVEQESDEINKLWIEEVEKRIKSYKNGESVVMDFMQKYDTDKTHE